MNIQSTLNEHVDLESNATSTICAEEVEEPSLGSRPDELESRLNENVVKMELGPYLVGNYLHGFLTRVLRLVMETIFISFL